MEETLEQLQEQLKVLQMRQELLRLQNSIQKLSKESPKEEIKLRVANGQIILPKGMTGKKLTQIVQPKIVSKTNYDKLQRIHSNLTKVREDLNNLTVEKLTENEIDELNLSINLVLDLIPTKTEENENMESDSE